MKYRQESLSLPSDGEALLLSKDDQEYHITTTPVATRSCALPS